MKALEKATATAKATEGAEKQAAAYRDKVVPALRNLRADIDALEGITPRDLWPVPVYADLLFKL